MNELQINVWLLPEIGKYELLAEDVEWWELAYWAIYYDCLRFVPDKSLAGGYYAREDGVCVVSTSPLSDSPLG